MNYNKLTGIVLKKQNYKEADQIATVYTLEQGKVRCLAKSLRSSKSKLSGSFQDFSLVQIDLAGRNGLLTLISAKSAEQYTKIKTNLTKTALAFYAAELVIKLTADEQINQPAYELLLGFFRTLNDTDADDDKLYLILNNFSLRFLNSTGFSLEFAADDLKLTPRLKDLMQKIANLDYSHLSQLEVDLATGQQIHRNIGQFIEYILERNIKSEAFLKQI